MRKVLLLIIVLGLAAYGDVGTNAQVQGQPQGQQGPGGGRGGQQRQPRDRAAVPQGTASISGRIVTADTGRPVKRARVTISGGGRGGRSTTTDDQGRYTVTALAAGSYSINASKAGFVDASYGQRRPLQPGTPLEIADGQQATNIDLRLIRGGVITGRVVDEDGEPLLRALVTVQRYQYVRGERTLLAAGGDQTDDRGQYRIFGLPPGDYYVSATVSGLAGALARGLQELAVGALGEGRGGRGAFGPFGTTDDVESTGYAPTYYPGVTSASEAGKVTVGPGQELAGIDFQVQLVPLATIRGIVSGTDQGASIMLAPQDARGAGLRGADILRGRTETGGLFTISNVPPGHYLAIARSGGRCEEEKIATQPVTVTGENISNLVLVLVPGVSLSGNITVESSGTPAPTDYSVFRIDVSDADPLPIAAGPFGGGRGGGGRAEKNGSFQVGNVMPGRHLLRVVGQGVWTLKSVSLGGRDVTDQPFEVKNGQDVGNIMVVMTDRSTELAGTVRDGTGTPIAGLTVIAFSTDPQYWRAQSREIQVSRTDQNGAYRLRNLPSGDYQIAVVDDVEQGEWFDPSYLQELQRTTKTVTLNEGDKKTLDLTSR